MKPIDYRNDTFESLRDRLRENREIVWREWQKYESRAGNAGATTREVAACVGMDIIAFRPRCTELYQLGVLMLVESEVGPSCRSAQNGSEGLYRLRTIEEWQAWFYAQRNTATISDQQQLALP